MNELNLPKNKKVILFDGVCNFCDTQIQKIIRLDKENQFVFASLQSEIGQEILKYIGVNHSIDSIVLYHPNVAYYLKSEAIFEIIKATHWSKHLISIIQIIPNKVTDFFYDFFAKNRYKWFGKKNECMVPTSEVRDKFL